MVPHRVLQVILLSLNAFLFYCAVVGVHRPHYEIMFILSLGLTGSYVWYAGIVSSSGAPRLCPRAPLPACVGTAPLPGALLQLCGLRNPLLTPCGLCFVLSASAPPLSAPSGCFPQVYD